MDNVINLFKPWNEQNIFCLSLVKKKKKKKFRYKPNKLLKYSIISMPLNTLLQISYIGYTNSL